MEILINIDVVFDVAEVIEAITPPLLLMLGLTPKTIKKLAENGAKWLR